MERNRLRQEISEACPKLTFSQNPVRLCQHQATPKQEEFLHLVFINELEHRERLRKDRMFRKAAFPIRKTLEGYEFKQVRFPASLSRDELLTCQFVRDKRNLVMYGPGRYRQDSSCGSPGS